ncbi:ABC transporter substrate-binding protein [Pseudomonas sp. DWRC2-2]|uniref:ABC transporter substrate-binding protein n=1 Tax=Pseudomonas sp. DWRC2-2 TaxID=2804567 RepID=UPI003CE77488
MVLTLCACERKKPAVVHGDFPVHGGTLVYASDREPTCLDPHVEGEMPQVIVAQQYLDSLVSMDSAGVIGPWLAKSWTISDNGLMYTFHLRDDVRFTDGTPFNAAAVKANLDHIVNPNTRSGTAGGYIRQYVGTDVVDDNTAVVHLATPYAAFLEVLAQGFLGMESPTALTRSRDINCKSPVGSGPFKVVKWDRQSQIELVRNPNYNSAPPTAKHQGEAYLDRIIWKFIEEPSVRFASLQAGEVDVIEALPPESHEAARRNPDISLIIAQRPGNPTNGTFNLRRAPFDDIRVREAFVRSADIESALKSVYFGEFPRAEGPLSTSTPFYSPDFEHSQDYDLDRAALLLDLAGWKSRDADGYRTKNGKRLQATVLIGARMPPSELTMWEQVQATTRQVGIDVVLDRMSDSQAAARQIAWDYDVRAGYWITNTPDVMRIIFSSAFIQPAGPGGFHQNSAGYSSLAFDVLMQSALTTLNPEHRRQLYYQAQQQIAEQYLQLVSFPQSARIGIYKTARGVRLEPSLGATYFYDSWVNK